MKSSESFAQNEGLDKKIEESPQKEEGALKDSLQKSKTPEDSFFDKIYKSKTARILTLLASLSSSGKFFNEEREVSAESSSRYEMVEKEGLDLGELKDIFSAKVEVSSKEGKYIIHIGDYHCLSTLKETKKAYEERGSDIKDLISIQKDTEKLLLHLTERYGIKDVFLEGVDIKNLREIRNLHYMLDKNDDGSEKTIPEQWADMISLYEIFKNESRSIKRFENTMEIDSNKFTEGYKSQLINLARESLKNSVESVKQSYETYSEDEAKASELPAGHIQLFRFWKINNIKPEKAFINLEKKINEISNHKLLKDGRIYVWGAAEKLYVEGKINIQPAESPRVYNFTDAKGITLEEKGFNIREDAAIRSIHSSRLFASKHFNVLVYGDNHDFSDNVKKMNESKNENLGLIRIDHLERPF
ncbi:MAG: hypothetical protein HW401_818 [Parcubacteria group bacterium]|nr:hypothetical protein [Parcubacteria group bacterium]